MTLHSPIDPEPLFPMRRNDADPTAMNSNSYASLSSVAIIGKILARRPSLLAPFVLLAVASWGAPWAVREEGGATWVLRLSELWGHNTPLALFWPSAAVAALALGLLINDIVRKEVDRAGVLVIPEMRRQLLALTLWAGVPVALIVACFVPKGTALPQHASLAALTLLVYLQGASPLRMTRHAVYALWMSLNILLVLYPLPFFLAVSAAPLLSAAVFLACGFLIWRGEIASDYRRAHAVRGVEVGEDTTELDFFPWSQSAQAKEVVEPADQPLRLWTFGSADSSLHSLIRATRYEESAGGFTLARIHWLVFGVVFAAIGFRLLGMDRHLLFSLVLTVEGSMTPQLLHMLSRRRRARLMLGIAAKRAFLSVLFATVVAYAADLLVFVPILQSTPRNNPDPALLALAFVVAIPVFVWIHVAIFARIWLGKAQVGTRILGKLSIALAAFLLTLPLVEWYAGFAQSHGVLALMLLSVLLSALTWGSLYVALRWRMNVRDFVFRYS